MCACWCSTASTRRRAGKLVSSFVNSTYFDVVAAPASMQEIERLMDRGQARVALVIPEA